MRLWNVVRELNWFAIIALVFILTALALVLFTPLWQLPVILGFAAVVSAVLSRKV